MEAGTTPKKRTSLNGDWPTEEVLGAAGPAEDQLEPCSSGFVSAFVDVTQDEDRAPVEVGQKDAVDVCASRWSSVRERL